MIHEYMNYLVDYMIYGVPKHLQYLHQKVIFESTNPPIPWTIHAPLRTIQVTAAILWDPSGGLRKGRPDQATTMMNHGYPLVN